MTEVKRRPDSANLPNHKKLPANPEAGSLAPIGKEFPLNALAIETLQGIEEDIKETHEKGVKAAIRYRLTMGAHLNNARELFPGDKEFGQWRKKFAEEHLGTIAPRTLSLFQQMAAQYGAVPKFVEHVGWSVAQELLTAPDYVMKDVQSKMDAGEDTPTTTEIREIKSGSNLPDSGTSDNSCADSDEPNELQSGSQGGGGVADSPAGAGGQSQSVEHRVPKGAGPSKEQDRITNIIKTASVKERLAQLEDVDTDCVTAAYTAYGLPIPESDHLYPLWMIEKWVPLVQGSADLDDEEYDELATYAAVIGEDYAD